MRIHRSTRTSRRGTAAIELATVLPLLFFIALVTTDFGRFAKYKITVENAARSGALYGSSWSKFNAISNQTDSTGIYNAAYADITNNLENLQPGDVAITPTPMTDAEGYAAVNVQVTVTFRPLFQFTSFVFNYSGSPVALTDTCTMRVRPRQ
ncbi:MAG: TadE-like protein [Gemmataceae bacterium]|nr:TadE-like protein [Gemmataceae bacterium]